ncbi:MAG: endopeptidase La [Prevotella sp.]|nr:endopeptidase La [Prevotella sp.]MDY5666045.1 endopeptidase La [Alloprevotella sp.]
MNIDVNPQASFSLIADFDGDMNELLHTPFDTTLPALILRNMMLFPGVVGSVAINRTMSLKVVNQSLKKGSLIAVLAQKDANVEEPERNDLYDEGVVARVMRTIDLPGLPGSNNCMAILQTYGPIKLEQVKRRKPTMRVEVSPIEEVTYNKDDEEIKALADACRDGMIKFLQLNDAPRSEEAIFAIKNISHPIFLISFICTNMQLSQDERYKLLQKHDQRDRAMLLLQIINRQIQFAQIKHDIQNQTRRDLDQQQREYFLHQQIKNIQSELGEGENSDVVELERKAQKLNMPQKVADTFKREIDKFKKINPQSPDYSIQLNYLQTIVALPWGIGTNDNLNIKNAERVLERDHYGMEKVKERILEHLATLRYRRNEKAPILCLVGPPGVGKTSLGRSIAEALGRKYVRISLGGVHDEAEIRGHRRTYIGAMPGRIIKGIMKAETNNPLFVLDEVDKVSENNYNGDPHSALLEVLDPEQNSTFHDNYLDLDFDLSKVFFIATANSLQTIPRPLLDRMEVIEVEGYLTEEKKEIARRHLIPKEQKEYDFGKEQSNDKNAKLKFTSSAIEYIIEKYTRESGVRQLEKQFDKIFRKVAYLTSTSEDGHMPYAGHSIKPADIEQLLGKPLFSRDKYQGNKYAGVVTGLAWTAVGGEILFIETSVSRSKGPKLTLTGNLGDVMKESAVLALEYIKSHADKLGIDYRVFDHWGVHIHVPEGATPKDGPSAGITIATSIASALTQHRVRDHIAMTGEITLRGHVLPVGGIKEKILAAKRAGITDIMISEENRKDVEEINERYVEGLTFHFVNDVQEVLQFALLNEKVDNAIELTFDDDANNVNTTTNTDADKKVAVHLLKEKD